MEQILLSSVAYRVRRVGAVMGASLRTTSSPCLVGGVAARRRAGTKMLSVPPCLPPPVPRLVHPMLVRKRSQLRPAALHRNFLNAAINQPALVRQILGSMLTSMWTETVSILHEQGSRQILCGQIARNVLLDIGIHPVETEDAQTAPNGTCDLVSLADARCARVVQWCLLRPSW